MARKESHIYKIYRGNEYVASAKYAHDAVNILSHQDWGKIKYKHKHTLIDMETDHDKICEGSFFDDFRAVELLKERLENYNAYKFHKYINKHGEAHTRRAYGDDRVDEYLANFRGC